MLGGGVPIQVTSNDPLTAEIDQFMRVPTDT